MAVLYLVTAWRALQVLGAILIQMLPEASRAFELTFPQSPSTRFYG
jgi:hypothetical protein